MREAAGGDVASVLITSYSSSNQTEATSDEKSSADFSLGCGPAKTPGTRSSRPIAKVTCIDRVRIAAPPEIRAPGCRWRGKEHAGVSRPKRPLICGDQPAPLRPGHGRCAPDRGAADARGAGGARVS